MLCTRPDIVYAVKQLSQFASDPSPTHLQAAKRVLRYLQGSQDSYLTYQRDHGTTGTIQEYFDANWASDEDRKSISGYSRRITNILASQETISTIALSTAEAEYAALTQAAKAIELQYCPTNDMLADIMTKALARDKHARMCQLIGMDGLLGNTSPSSSEVMSVLGSKEELGIGEWECGNTPLPARTMLVAYAIR